MGHWVKMYSDGTKYTGTDIATRKKEASWRKSRNDGIVRVMLKHNDFSLSIRGVGEYWQSDEWEAEFPSGKPAMTKRRIMKKIESNDIIVCIRKSLTECSLRFDFHNPRRGEQVKITNETMVGKWAVVEVDLVNQTVYTYFSPKKI